MVTGNTSREHPHQQTHYLRKNVTYNTTGIGTAATVKMPQQLPPNAIILSTYVKINTAFNAGTNNPIHVGTSGNSTALVDGGTTGAGDGDIDSTATGMNISYRGGDLAKSSNAQDIYIHYNQSGDAATAGDADVIVEYVPNNDD